FSLFTVIQANGTACFTTTNDAVNGFFITANRPCLLAFSFSTSSANVAAKTGFTLNPTPLELTQSFTGLPPAKKLCNASILGIAANSGACSFYRIVTAGEKIYLQTDLGLTFADNENFFVSVASLGSSSGASSAGASVDDNLVSFQGTTGDLLQDSGISALNVVQMSATATFVDRPLLTAGLNKSIKQAGYGVPTSVCALGEILKSDGTNYICAVDGGATGGDVFGPASSVANQIALFSDATGKLLKNTPFTFPATVCPTGNVLQSDGTDYICVLNGLGTGDVTGPTGAVNNNLSSFDLATGKLIKDSGILSTNVPTMAAVAVKTNAPITSAGLNKTQRAMAWSIPFTVCTAGQILKSDGTDMICGTDNDTIGGTGDVVGPAVAVVDHIATYSNITGKLIKDGGIVSTDINTMTTAAGSANRALISGGADKTLFAASYTLPATNGTVGQLLTYTAAGVASWANAPVSLPADGGLTDLVLMSNGTGSGQYLARGTVNQVLTQINATDIAW
ncbi:hypothetical protein MUP35_04255, partial [Patescibacteria group bacterium]|nr:hypothetical protein [Patescibacteria group bacterium]